MCSSDLLTPPDAHVVRFVQDLLNDHTPPRKIAFGTEGGLFAERCGIPTVVCGPGDIAQAHQPNEFILASQITACEGFMKRMMEWCVRG